MGFTLVNVLVHLDRSDFAQIVQTVDWADTVGAVMDTGVNMVAFARMDSCPVRSLTQK